mgnify:CR=1 FL=1
MCRRPYVVVLDKAWSASNSAIANDEVAAGEGAFRTWTERPVREITIASDLVSMLKAVRGVGSEARWVPFGGSVKAAPLLLDEMSVGGS